MASTLTMANVPWHEEVVSFTSQLCNLLDNQYELAAEHEHSNCILVAHKKFKVDSILSVLILSINFHSLMFIFSLTVTDNEPV